MIFNNVRVHIDRGDLLLRRAAAQLRDQVAVHLAQAGVLSDRSSSLG